MVAPLAQDTLPAPWNEDLRRKTRRVLTTLRWIPFSWPSKIPDGFDGVTPFSQQKRVITNVIVLDSRSRGEQRTVALGFRQHVGQFVEIFLQPIPAPSAPRQARFAVPTGKCKE